jgi:FAD/FMN-containing dehydrogenase
VSTGWLLPVTPGTQQITVGGAIANDVHGKNHHRMGSFGHHVHELTLLRTDGTSMICSPTNHADWFYATIGGIGLTGVIVSAEIQLRRVDSPWLSVETMPYHSLSEFFHLANTSESNWEHTVSWIDCLSTRSLRGIFMRANHINDPAPIPRAHKRTMPFTPPISLVNRASLRVLNSAYFYLNKRQVGPQKVPYTTFFYPLDQLRHWNRMYGPKGFFQYQCLIPRVDAEETIHAMLRRVAKSKTGSCLAVLKTFGDIPSKGMLSFPGPGVTLALDFPNLGQKTRDLMHDLDDLLLDAKGRIYLAKDARMPRAVFEAGYPHFNTFAQYRDPGIQSGLSRRLMGDLP